MTTSHNLVSSTPESIVAQTLIDVNQSLAQCLEALKSLGPTLPDTLHPDDALPSLENMKHAATAVDTLHQIQLILDPPALILADHFLGYVKSKCLLAAVQQGIPAALGKEPMTLEALAKSTHSRNDRLAQIMRILCSQGVFSFDYTTELYSNSLASSLIHPDHWTQWHNWVSLYGTQFYDIARGIPDSIIDTETRSAAQINFNTNDDMFKFFRAQDWAPQLHRTLGGGAVAQLPGILEDYPWHEVADGLVMDIGGGGGDFIAGLLRKYPTMQGGLFDQPHIIEHVRPFLAAGGKHADVSEQLKDENLVGGDFFVSVPRCAIYTMKWCLHDWKDEKAIAILKTIRNNITVGPKSRLVVLESVLSMEASGRLSQYGDINMMMTIDGQERTETQWHRLATLSGWKLQKIWDLRRAWVKAMDFHPV